MPLSLRGSLTSAALRRALRAAERLLASNRSLSRVAAAAAVLRRNPRAGLGRLGSDVAAMVRLVREVVTGHYRTAPRRTLLAAVAGLIYFLDPLDIIPDVVPLIGFLDDTVILAWVLRQVRHDLDAFLRWEAMFGGAIDTEARPAPAVKSPAAITPLP